MRSLVRGPAPVGLATAVALSLEFPLAVIAQPAHKRGQPPLHLVSLLLLRQRLPVCRPGKGRNVSRRPLERVVVEFEHLELRHRGKPDWQALDTVLSDREDLEADERARRGWQFADLVSTDVEDL